MELGVGSNTPVLTASFARHRKSTENDTVRPSYGYFMTEIGGERMWYDNFSVKRTRSHFNSVELE